MTSRRDFIGAALAASAVGTGCATTAAAEGISELPASTGPEQTDDPSLRVRFLGTGAADWERAPRTGKIYRRWSCVLIDNRFLIDFTHKSEDMIPDGCRPKAILYTHSHPDHYDPKAALKLGVKHVFASRTWIADTKAEYEKVLAAVGGELPVFHPLDVGKRFRLGPYEILPVPGNHYADRWYEQALLYKVTKLCKDGPARLFYATDTSGIMSSAYFLACRSKEPINAVIMESCGRPGHKFDGLSISHSTADRVKEIFSTILKPGKSAYRPSSPDQPVYLTHVGYGDWGTNTFDEELGPGFRVASDGQEIEVRPLSKD